MKSLIRSEAVKKLWENPEYRQHMSDTHKGQKTYFSRVVKKGVCLNTGRTRFKVGQLANEKHHFWKGDEAGYNAIHTWVRKNLGSPSKCEECKTTEAKRFEWANISGEYKRDLSDWKRLCTKCHASEHKNWEKRWGTK